MKNILTLCIFAVFAISTGFAQLVEEPKHFSTHSHGENGEIIWHYPDLREEAMSYVKPAPPVVTVNEEGKSNEEYVVTVVFHILHMYGTENISDAQVYDALEVMNREFNAADPDSVELVPEFQNLHANARVTFKLAALDPFGNCTNGIEHIHTHETRVGDAFSKLNQWDRSRYLNIWVVEVVGSPGAAAYVFKPAATDGSGFFLDGIVSNHTYVGSIGTSNPFREATITHELGHYFNLDHPWGPTNETGQGCGDDGVADTPVTEGWSNCLSLGNADNCNPGIQENVQNYMEYSFCGRNFTPGQVTFMHNALQGISGQRNNLWLDSTLLSTGVRDLVVPQDPSNELSVPLCAPVADFFASRTTACAGSPITFTDVSWNAVIENRTWTFEGGTPSTSTSPVANVTFDTPGWKVVTLTVSNAAGSDTREETQYIYISGDWGENVGPTSFDMESTNAPGTGTDFFLTQNIENNFGSFGVVSGVGYDNSKCWKLQNYFDNSNADPWTDEAFYYNRLGLSEDHLITPAVDLRNTTNVEVTFKYAYATNATNTADITENITVSTSNNCGESWTPRIISSEGQVVGSSLSGEDLVTAGYAGFSDFAPQDNLMWKTGSISFNPTGSDNKTRIRFTFEASDLASNLYIDNIQINGTLSLTDDIINEMDINVFPNPNQGEAISVSYIAQNEPVTFTLRDAQGKILSVEENSALSGQVTHSIANSSQLTSAMYFLEIRSGEFSTTKKVVVL